MAVPGRAVEDFKAGEPVVFSSNTILSDRRDFSLSPIPLCSILKPFFFPKFISGHLQNQQSAVIPMVQKKSLISCSNSKCKAYLNPFCKLDPDDNRKWCCIFCSTWSFASELNVKRSSTNGPLQSPVNSDAKEKMPAEITSNVVDLFVPYQYIANATHNLATGPAARYRRTSSGSTNEATESFNSIIQPTNLVSRSFSATSNASNTGSDVMAPAHPACIYVIDSNIPKGDLTSLASAITSALHALPKNTYIGLITFGHCVKVYEVGMHGMVSCDSYPGHSKLDEGDFEQMEAHERNPRYNGSEYMLPLHFCVDNLILILKNLSGGPDARLQRKRRKRQAKFKSPGGPEEDDTMFNNCIHVSPTKRCLSNAIRAGLELFKVSHETLGKMVVCTTGELNYGPTDAQYLRLLSQECMMQSVAIDIFCVGSNHFDVPRLQSIVQYCGGHVHIHRSFDEKAFALNVLSATTGFRLSTQTGGGSDNASASMSSFYQDTSCHGIRVDVQCSDCIDIERVIGPAVSNFSGDENSVGNVEDCDAEMQRHSFRFGALNPSDAGIAMYFQLLEDASTRFGYVQFTVTFNGMDGSVRKRVITKRLLFTSSRQLFLKSIDGNVASVGIAKKAILMAQKLGQKWAVEELDTLVFNMMHFFADEHHNAAKKKLKSGAKVPEELRDVPVMLFHLVRGPCLGPILQHDDDIRCMQNILLNSSLEVCLRIIHPQLYCVRQEDILRTRHLIGGHTSGEDEDNISHILAQEITNKHYMRNVPIVSLALQSNVILILDHHADIFVWSGHSVSGPEYDKIRSALVKILNERVKHRYPHPNIMLFNENDSMARWFEARLIPAHKDNEFLQMQDCQLLIGNLSHEQRNQLSKKLLWTDDKSYHEWLGHVIHGK